MLNYLWLALVTLAVLIGGATGRLREVTEGAFQMADMAVMKIALPLAGIMALWLGVMRLAEQSGLVQKLAAALRPLMSRLFPDVPADHPAMGSMVMNMAANMLGLANAATPLGLRAMRDLETLNRTPGTATNAMCTFLAINTSSIQLLPTTAIAILASQHAQDPTAIVGTAFLATICSTVAGVVAVKAMQNWPMFRVPPGAAAVVSPSATLDPIPLRLPPAPAPRSKSVEFSRRSPPSDSSAARCPTPRTRSWSSISGRRGARRVSKDATACKRVASTVKKLCAGTGQRGKKYGHIYTCITVNMMDGIAGTGAEAAN